MKNEQQLVTCPLDQLGLSHDFEKKSREMGFRTLADILALPAQELRDREGFSYRWLEELVSVLTSHNMLHLLQPLPGNIRG